MSLPAAAVLDRLRRFHAADRADADLLRDYAERRDEEAFRMLLDRHGPLVLRLCRTRLGDGPAAEDAFQATFLALARRAGAIAPRHAGAVAGWLYETARRIACKAHVVELRRRRREGAMAWRTAADPTHELTARELVQTLDEELSRLPEAYRLPLLLC